MVMKKEQFDITGMSCAACSSRIDKTVSALKGIQSVNVNLLKNSMTVIFNEQEIHVNAIIQAVTQIGYGATLKSDFQEANTSQSSPTPSTSKTEVEKIKWRLIFSALGMFPLFYINMGHMAGLPLPAYLMGTENMMVSALVQLTLATFVILMNINYFLNGFKTLIALAPNMDSLIAMGSGAAYLSGICSIYVMAYTIGHGDIKTAHSAAENLYLESAAMILTLITMGRFLEAKAKGKTSEAISKLLDLSPKTATRFENGIETIIPIENVQKNDILIIRAGEQIPTDGIIIEGWGSIDESPLTGESIPVEKQMGDTVSGACINLSGHFLMRVTHIGKDTVLAQIIRLIDEATSSKAPISRLADTVSGIFVPIVIAIALAATAIWLLLGYSIPFALSIGISVLVISCPCSLGLATPTAIMVGTGQGAANGILFKSARAIEQLGTVDTVVLDKTGTMTEGKPVLTDIITHDVTHINKWLQKAASLENYSEHPLGKAIINGALKRGLSLNKVSDFKQIPGTGILGEIENCHYAIGNARLLPYLDIKKPSSIYPETANQLAENGKIVLYFICEKTLLALFAVADKIKPSTPNAIHLLQSMGLNVTMLTGDNRKTAQTVQRQTGISSFKAEILPQDKEKEIRQFIQQGHLTAMVGDGINDAPALARADVGIAIGKGTDIAIESADVVLMKNDLIDVVSAIHLSRSVMNTIKQNLFWAFFYNIIGIPIAAGVLYAFNGMTLNPMIAATAMSFSSVSVVLNALRLRFFKSVNRFSALKHDISPNDPTIAITSIERKLTMQKNIQIEGMNCNHCRTSVEKALSNIPGVTHVEVSLENKKAILEASEAVTDAMLKTAITQAGFEVKAIQ